MGLKAFHIFFITIACLFSFGAAALFLQLRGADSGPLPIAGAVISFVTGIMLLFYGAWALKKLKAIPKE
jgi:hypothetical protein